MSHFTQGHALLIGVGADLPNTITDAIGLATLLQDPERCAYPAPQVHTLTGEHATRAAILATLDQLAAQTGPDATVIFYFSGHGYTIGTITGKVYFLMPYGYDVNDLPATAISGVEFMAKLKAIPAQKMLVLLDCCHAGGMDNAKALGAKFSKAPIPPEAQELLAQGSGRVIIASSRADELSYAGDPYSEFTQALVEALAGAGAAEQDGYVRTADLALYARETVPKQTNDRQHPVLDYAQADNFIVAYYAAGDKQPKGLPEAAQRKTNPDAASATLPAKPSAVTTTFNQSGQNVHGNQNNIAGDVNTGGGLFNTGHINTRGGDLVSRDKNVYGDQVRGDKITTGNLIGNTGVSIGRNSRVNVNPGVSNQQIAPLLAPILAAAEAAPAEVRQLAVEKAQALKTEVTKSDQPDDSLLADLIQDLTRLVPTAVSAVVAAFASPLLGGIAGPITKHILKRLGVQ